MVLLNTFSYFQTIHEANQFDQWKIHKFYKKNTRLTKSHIKYIYKFGEKIYKIHAINKLKFSSLYKVF